MTDPVCPDFLGWAARRMNGGVWTEEGNIWEALIPGKDEVWLCTFLEEHPNYHSYNMWRVFRCTPGPGTQLLLGELSWAPPQARDSKTRQPFRVPTGIPDYILGWSLSFHPELRWVQEKLILQCLLEYGFTSHSQLQNSRTGAAAIPIKREGLDSLWSPA